MKISVIVRVNNEQTEKWQLLIVLHSNGMDIARVWEKRECGICIEMPLFYLSLDVLEKFVLYC